MPELNPTDEFDSLSSEPLPGVDAAGDGSPANAPQASLRDDLDMAYAQLQDQRNAYVRLLADFDNYKKRAERLSGERADDERRKLLTQVLSVADNLERASSFRDKNVPAERLVDGVLATIRQFRDFLESEGVRPIDVIGKPFDPSVAEAIAVQADAGAPDNVVTEVARKGYMLGDTLLRPAQVVVSKSKE